MNTFGQITVRECVNVAPVPDARCQDLAFAISNPGICPAAPHLIIKPGQSLVPVLGSTQFRAFMVTSGVEQDVSSDCVWQTSSAIIALIGASSGNATGLSAGDVTISATYGDYSATAEMAVMGAGGGSGSGGSTCASQQVGMMMLVDTSKSMSQDFSGSYASRLAFAKAAAARFASEINETKDLIGLITFNASGATTEDALTSDKDTVEADANAIAQTQQKTSFYAALQSAITQLDAAAVDFRVIVLISDGEDTSADAPSGYGDDDNPLSLIANFKDGGGIVICLGCRASGVGFSFLSILATGGFFVNGYGATESDTLNFLSGLKGYICAGDCCINGDQMVSEGKLNYDGFTNWNVTGGTVDLLGNGFIDLLPENGLYVDLAGSDGTRGRMVSKTPFALTSGHQYRVSLLMAGNQRVAGTSYSAKVQVFYASGTSEIPMLSQSILITDYAQDFHPYSFTFTAPADVDAYISIQQTAIPTGNNANFGLLLDQLQFDDVTDLVNLLTDTFDSENEVYVPPCCGLGSVLISGEYMIGYNCYGVGCLTDPPPAQSPDPTPLPNIESGGYIPPKVYTSQKTACATCPAGSQNQIARIVAQMHVPAGPHPTTDLNGFSGDVPIGSVISGYQVLAQIGAGYQTPVAWRILGDGVLLAQRTGTANPWNSIQVTTNRYGDKCLFYEFATPQTCSTYKICIDTVIDPTGIADCVFGLQLLGAGTAPAQVCATGTGTGATQAAADAAANAAALVSAQALLNCQPGYTATEQVILKCPTGTCGPDVVQSSTATSFISQADAESKARAAATAAAQTLINADCLQSNNTQPIVLPAVAWNESFYGQALPFPSVQYVTETGAINSVTVTLKDIGAGVNGNSFQMLLRSPGGTWVVLWSDRGSSNLWVAATTITIDDNGIAMPTAPTAITNGETYLPNNGDLPPVLTMPPGTPAAGSSDYNFALSNLVGEERQGAWSLWVAVRLTSKFSIAGGFEVTIT